LLRVGKSFQDDVASAPNTNMLLRTKDEATAQYFRKASAEIAEKRRTLQIEQTGFLRNKYEDVGRGSETEIRETRSKDERIKNLPRGQMEILMTDHRLGTLHSHLHIRLPQEHRFPGFQPIIYPRLYSPESRHLGANLRFKSPEMSQRASRLQG